jgi:hypothetical protein
VGGEKEPQRRLQEGERRPKPSPSPWATKATQRISPGASPTRHQCGNQNDCHCQMQGPSTPHSNLDPPPAIMGETTTAPQAVVDTRTQPSRRRRAAVPCRPAGARDTSRPSTVTPKTGAALAATLSNQASSGPRRPRARSRPIRPSTPVEHPAAIHAERLCADHLPRRHAICSDPLGPHLARIGPDLACTARSSPLTMLYAAAPAAVLPAQPPRPPTLPAPLPRRELHAVQGAAPLRPKTPAHEGGGPAAAGYHTGFARRLRPATAREAEEK